MTRARAHTAILATLLLLGLAALPGCVAYNDTYRGGGYHGRGYGYAQASGGYNNGWANRPQRSYGWR